MKINLKVKSKSAVLMINSMVHCGYQMKKNNMRELLLQKDIILFQKNSFFKKRECTIKNTLPRRLQ